MSKKNLLVKNNKLALWIDEISNSPMRLDTALEEVRQSGFEARNRILKALSAPQNLAMVDEVIGSLSSQLEDCTGGRNRRRCLDYWLLRMSGRVDDLLGCKTMLPKIAYADSKAEGIYEQFKGSIIIAKRNETAALPFLVAHEYSHHVEYCTKEPLKWLYNRPLAEGCGNGCAAITALDEGTENADRAACAYVYSSLIEATGNYIALRETGIRQGNEGQRLADTAVGTTAFLLAEKMHGRGVYREIIMSNKPEKVLLKMLERKHRKA
ncbi:MAG: hypothetical protein KJ955_07380 [Nanoarchaeota archaeon]|nr:hypothetical protein [Nanoarchaeota archaeon]